MQAGEVTGPRCCKVSPGLYASSYRRCAPATLYEASHEHREHWQQRPSVHSRTSDAVRSPGHSVKGVAGAKLWTQTRPCDVLWATEWGGSDKCQFWAQASRWLAYLLLHSSSPAIAMSKTCQCWPDVPGGGEEAHEELNQFIKAQPEPATPRWLPMGKSWILIVKSLQFGVVYYVAKADSLFS